MWGCGLFLGVTCAVLLETGQHGLQQKENPAKIAHIAPQNDPLPDTSASQNHNMQIEKTDFHEAGSGDNKNKWSLETSEREPPAFTVGI